MGAPSFKECVAADIFGVFLNNQEFADKHMVNGQEMTVLVDENELLERDKAKAGELLGARTDTVYKSRRLIYVARSEFGPRPANGAALTLDKRAYKVKSSTEEMGILAIELEANKS